MIQGVAVRFVLVSCLLILTSFGCSSCKKSDDNQQANSSVKDAPSSPGETTGSNTAASQSVDSWIEDLPVSQPKQGHSMEPPQDPDGVIAKYDQECPEGSNSDNCRDLRAQVEQVFLNDLVALRAAGQDIDPEWYRVAALSDTPQLACIGLRELIYAPQRTSEDEAAIIAALESPWRGVRSTVLNEGGNLQAIKDLRARGQIGQGSASGTCVDGWRDPEPGLKWAGGYPGARFRYFASSPSMRWFTTTDPLDKVLAYFNKSGKKALTWEEMQADTQAKFVEEATRISSSSDPGNEAKLQDLMQKMVLGGTNWSAPFTSISGTGEIRYVMLSPKQAIAIFQDDVLHATSIVAARPPAGEVTLDLEKAKIEAEERAILGI